MNREDSHRELGPLWHSSDHWVAIIVYHCIWWLSSDSTDSWPITNRSEVVKTLLLPYLHLTSCPCLVISIRFLSFKDLFLLDLDFHLATSRFLPFNNPSGLPTNNPWRAWYARDERCCLALALARQKEAFKRKQIMVQWKMGPCKISFLEIRGYFSTEPWTFWEKGVTLPKTNSKFAPENGQTPKRK